MPLRFTLRQLEYFVAVAEEGSVAAAAVRAHVAQPSISFALAKLEESLGLQLLIRHHARGVTLTPAGRRILVAARGLLRQAHEIEHDQVVDGAQIVGRLELAAFVSLAPVFLPALIAGFSERYPGVEVGLHEGTQDGLVRGLQNGRYDLALLYDLELPDNLAVKAMATAQPYVLLPKGHALARKKEVSLAALADEPMILLDVSPSRTYFIGIMRQAGVEPKIVFSTPSIEMVRGLVGRGRGYSLLVTRPHGDRAYSGEALEVRPIAEKVTASRIALARLESSQASQAMAAFSSFCESWFKENPLNI